MRYVPGRGYVPNERGTLFIRGPIPMVWVSAAAALPGKALNVALALLWLDGMQKIGTIKVTKKALELFNISADAYRDGLCRLRAVGLVKVQDRPGRRAAVEIIRSRADASPEALTDDGSCV